MSIKEKNLWKQLWTWLQEEKRMLFLLSIVIVLNVAFAVIGPLMLKNALDQLDLTQIETDALFFTSIYALMLILIFFSDMGQSMVVAAVNSRFINKLRVDAFTKILNNNITFFDKTVSGRLVSRVVNDSNELTNSAERLSHSFAQLFVFLGVLVTMFVYDFKLTLASTIVVPVLLFAVIMMRKFQRRISLNWRAKIAIVNANFGEIMSSISISKSFGRENENFVRFTEMNEQTYHASKIRAMGIFAVGPIQDFLKHLGIILLLFVATTIDNLSISLLYLFILLQGYLYTPISHIARAYNQFQTSFAALERLLEIMANDETQEDMNTEGLMANEIQGEINFQNIFFSYVSDELVLDNLNLNIEAGSTVALVGHTGAGKSTIVALLMRFYGGYAGDILIDGKRIEDYQLKSLRKNISYVAQDVFLFSGTILDNMKIAKPDATIDEIKRALDAVQATEFLETLPKGLHTELTEEGKNLSQGQKQMIALARALLADPKILILDEFTASLDLYTEAKIQEGIAALIKNRTSIVIAHRLTTILNSDKIIVLKNGKTIEEGIHDELMRREGEYAGLFEKYFSFQLSDLKLKN